MREVETEVRTLREKICKVREDAAAAEEANIVLRAENRQKDVELDEVRKVIQICDYRVHFYFYHFIFCAI